MDAEPSVDVRCSSFPGSSLGATASDGCQEGCEEGREEGREEVSAGAWGSISQVVVIECSCMDVGHFFRDVRDTSCIASLEIGGLRDPLWTSRLTSSGLAQGCEEDREEGDEGEEVAPEQGEEGGGREERCGHEEGGQGHLRAEDAVAGPGGDLRQEGDAAH